MMARLRRMFRHRWLDESDTRRAIPRALIDKLAAQVADSECRHSGEIRIYVEAGLPMSYLWRDASPRERAIAMFGKLGVWDTEQNNGVLVYLLLAEHAIEIVADRGLSRHVGRQQWQQIVQRMGTAFHAGRYEEGLCEAVDAVTSVLVQHFPAPAGGPNPNELPDEPVLG